MRTNVSVKAMAGALSAAGRRRIAAACTPEEESLVLASMVKSSRTQIVIPMSGFGERFRAAGYRVPKPLIQVDGKAIVEHVVDLFPGETDFLFVCNEDHLAEPSFRMREVLEAACPTGRIVGIPAHRLGPVWAVLSARAFIDPARPVMVNYCDFSCLWDWEDFKDFVEADGCDGAIPAYRGFHPHSLGSTYYAYLRQEGGVVSAIQEKKPWTDDPMSEFASSGGYWFKSGALMEAAFRRVMDEKIQVGGEHYVSLAYIPLLEEGRRVLAYEIPRFLQWGTPQDLDEYKRWSSYFRARSEGASPPRPPVLPGWTVVPAAGLGSRFAEAGWSTPKPLLPVDGLPMIARAASDLPATPSTAVVLRRDMPSAQAASDALSKIRQDLRTVWLDAPTDGQARTVSLALSALGLEVSDEPLTIGACDNGVDCAHERLPALLSEGADVVIWGVRGHPVAVRRPEHFGWIDAAPDGSVRGVSVKLPLSSPRTDPIVIGAFTFKRAKDYVRCAESLYARDGRVNGEFYADSVAAEAIALGLRVVWMEADAFPCWGTPDEYRTYRYWQTCFDAWSGHPYSIRADASLPSAAAVDLATDAPVLRAPRPGPDFPLRPVSVGAPK